MAKIEAAQGFGFRPSASVHHFVVTLGVKDEQVIISEHFDWEEHEEKRKLSLAIGNPDNQVRVLLPRAKWDAIAAAFADSGTLPIIDSAYQGLGRGMEEDAYGVRRVLAAVPEALVLGVCSSADDGLMDSLMSLHG